MGNAIIRSAATITVITAHAKVLRLFIKNYLPTINKHKLWVEYNDRYREKSSVMFTNY